MDAFLPQFAPADPVGLSIGWLFLAIFAGTLISEDATCISAGALAAMGEVSLAFAIGACFAGIVTGDLALYWAGRIFGRRIAAWPLTNRFFADARISRASDWLTQRGASAVFISRFVTGLRLPTYLAAGFLRTDFIKFAFYFILAAAIWTPLVVGTVALSGDLSGASIGVSAIGIFIMVRLGMKVPNRRSRRM